MGHTVGDLSPALGMTMVPSGLPWYVAQDIQRSSPVAGRIPQASLLQAASDLDERPGGMQREGSSSGKTNLSNYPPE